jgi:acyl-CoA reductase-like NAD-dependent aldehyde dehydrogenase
VSEPTIEAEPRQCWIAGRPERGEHTLTVRHPFDGTDVADVTVAGPEQVERAIAGAAEVARHFRDLPAARRAGTLTRIADLLSRRAEEVAETITAESGKPWQLAEREVTDAVGVFRAAAGDAIGFAEALARSGTDAAGRLTVVRRRARGPVLAIGAFACPLAGLARQLAPAIAIGAPVLSKPAVATPLSALLLAEILADTDLPAGTFSVLPLRDKDVSYLVEDPRLPVVAFTGSRAACDALRAATPGKQFVFELGTNTAAIVCPDLAGDADLDHAAQRIARSATAQAGQARLAVRRVFVHRDLAARFEPKLLAAMRALATGSPHDPDVTVGPLIGEKAAILATQWINEAIAVGARLLTGGVRDRATLTPTVLAVRPEFAGEEILGPIVLLSAVDTVRSAVEAANATESGLPVGVFSHDVRTGLVAADELDSDVAVGDLPTDAGTDDLRLFVEGYTERQIVVLGGGRAD